MKGREHAMITDLIKTVVEGIENQAFPRKY